MQNQPHNLSVYEYTTLAEPLESFIIWEAPAPYDSEPLRHRFLSSVLEVSPNLYSFHAQDLFHGLHYSLKLELHDWLSNGNGNGRSKSRVLFMQMIVCDFPALGAQTLPEEIQDNAFLYENITKQFYLYILESLLSFCVENETNALMLFVEDRFHSLIEIYRPFISSERELFVERGNKIRMTIATDHSTLDNCTELRKSHTRQFQLGLWQRQHENPTIRKYLQDLRAWEYILSE